MEQPDRSLSELAQQLSGLIPVRDQPVTHQCVCLLIHRGDEGEIRDKCHAHSSSPDAPFCVDCERAGHPDLHEQAWERAVKKP